MQSLIKEILGLTSSYLEVQVVGEQIVSQTHSSLFLSRKTKISHIIILLKPTTNGQVTDQTLKVNPPPPPTF